MAVTTRSPLHETVATTATDFWNDSCSLEELAYAIEHGAVGATSNPTIVGEVLKKEWALWSDRIGELVAEAPTATEDDVAWRLIEEMAVKASRLLVPVHGRLSIQTNPKLYRDTDRLVEQGLHFASLAPNVQVKVPDFRRAYEPDGLTVDEFDSFGATVRTLRGFIASYQELVATVRDVMLPNPD
jgi:transaldolase